MFRMLLSPLRRGFKPVHSRTCMDSLVRVSRRAIRRLAGQHNEVCLTSMHAKAGSNQLAVPWPTLCTNTRRRHTTRTLAVVSRSPSLQCHPEAVHTEGFHRVTKRVDRQREAHLTPPGQLTPKRLSFPRYGNLPELTQAPHAFLTAVSGTFNSLSKVLCIFPSRYFCATGLEYLWGIKWSIPPNWRSHFRERDSASTCRAHTSQRPDGILTLHNSQCQRTSICEYADNVLHQIVEAESFCLQVRCPLYSLAITKRIIFILFSSAHLYA